MNYEQQIEEARALVAEYDRQRKSVPGVFPGQYTTKRENRAMELKDADVAFLNYIRSGKESKALVEDATGRFLVSPQITTEIEREVTKLAVMRNICSQKTLTGTDRVQVRRTNEVTVSWGKLETGTDITESDLVPEPPTYKYVEDLYGLSKVGEDELADSDINLANLLVDSFSLAIATAEDLAFVAGTGHDNEQPDGFIVDATLVAAAVETTASGSVTVEKFLEMIYTMPSKFRRDASFIVHSLTALFLRQLRSKDQSGGYEGAFLWQPSTILGEPPTFLGYPIYTQDDFKTLTDVQGCLAALGNFKRGYKVLDHDSGITVQRLVELYAEAGLVGFKVHKRVGGYCIRQANKAIVLLTEAT